MNIVKLQAENIKRIVAVEIEPDGALVQITGRNGAGKSSILDAIWWALAGERSHQSAPIRKGSDTARIRLDLGDVIVTRQFAKRAVAEGAPEGAPDAVVTRITVETAEGARFPSPQTMLDALLGSLSFDPLAFARASDRAQVEMLAGLCGVDLATVERANKGDFDRRRDCNRDAKQKRSAAGQIAVPSDTPDAEISVAELAQKLRTVEAENRAHDRERSGREGTAARISRERSDADAIERLGAETVEAAERRAADLRSEADAVLARANIEQQKAEQQARSMREPADKAEARLLSLDPVDPDTDTEPFQQKIEDAERVNRDVAAAERKHALSLDAIEAERKAKALTDSMDARRRKVANAIAAADLGIEGLTVQDGRVMLGAVPFEQASDAERLRLSCAIAMRGDAKLKVLRVRDGSLLDADSLALLREMAESADYQVWIEMVDSSGTVGIVIEDGRVKADATDE